MTRPFYVVKNPNISAKELNRDLQLVSEWANKCKMSFNPDKNKQAQQVVLSRKQSKPQQP